MRDLPPGREPKDFDVGTELPPRDLRVVSQLPADRAAFPSGDVRFGRDVIEVATFRVHTIATARTMRAPIPRTAVFRATTCTAAGGRRSAARLHRQCAVLRHQEFLGSRLCRGHGGLGVRHLRLIGDPQQRYREDPVRMLRAVRFAAKLGFRIDPASEAGIYALGQLLQDIPPARLFEEIMKLFLGGCAVSTFELLRHYDLFRYLFPLTDKALSCEEQGFPITFVLRALENTDQRLAEGKPVTPAFLYAALLWEPMRLRSQELQQHGASPLEAVQMAGNEITAQQVATTSLPKRFSMPMREIWTLQPRFERKRGKTPYRLLEHPRFRAAYDFLLLRAEVGEASAELARWWTDFQSLNARGARPDGRTRVEEAPAASAAAQAGDPGRWLRSTPGSVLAAT